MTRSSRSSSLSGSDSTNNSIGCWVLVLLPRRQVERQQPALCAQLADSPPISVPWGVMHLSLTFLGCCFLGWCSWLVLSTESCSVGPEVWQAGVSGSTGCVKGISHLLNPLHVPHTYQREPQLQVVAAHCSTNACSNTVQSHPNNNPSNHLTTLLGIQHGLQLSTRSPDTAFVNISNPEALTLPSGNLIP